MRAFILVIVCAIILPASAQKSIVSTNNSTDGVCSPVINSPNAPVLIQCPNPGLSKQDKLKQERNYSDILSAIRKQGFTLEQVLRALDVHENSMKENQLLLADSTVKLRNFNLIVETPLVVPQPKADDVTTLFRPAHLVIWLGAYFYAHFDFVPCTPAKDSIPGCVRGRILSDDFGEVPAIAAPRYHQQWPYDGVRMGVSFRPDYNYAKDYMSKDKIGKVLGRDVQPKRAAIRFCADKSKLSNEEQKDLLSQSAKLASRIPSELHILIDAIEEDGYDPTAYLTDLDLLGGTDSWPHMTDHRMRREYVLVRQGAKSGPIGLDDSLCRLEDYRVQSFVTVE